MKLKYYLSSFYFFGYLLEFRVEFGGVIFFNFKI
jgi:hypothetical protein